MAASPRGLVFVLTMAAWLAASIHTGSSHSGWWGTQEAHQLRQAARVSIAQGNFDQAERAYLRSADLAARHRDPLARALSMEGVGSARFAGFHYRGALDAYLEARGFAERARDRRALGAIDADLASVYQQTWDLDSAVRSAEEAQTIIRGLPDVYYRPQLLLLLGRLRQNTSSIPLFREGIEAARRASFKEPSLVVVEANGWDFLCEALIESGDLEGADAAEKESLALRRSSDPRDLGFSEWLLGAIRLKQAARLTTESAEDDLPPENCWLRPQPSPSKPR